MTAELLPQPESFTNGYAEVIPLRPQRDALSADELELAMQHASQLGEVSAVIRRNTAEYAYDEALRQGASAEELFRLGHQRMFWRTVAIDTGSIPSADHHSREYYQPED